MGAQVGPRLCCLQNLKTGFSRVKPRPISKQLVGPGLKEIISISK